VLEFIDLQYEDSNRDLPAGSMARVVEGLPSKEEALSPTPSTTKKKQKQHKTKQWGFLQRIIEKK
jgi:hypothetical protein